MRLPMYLPRRSLSLLLRSRQYGQLASLQVPHCNLAIGDSAHWINFAAPIAVSIVSRQDWILPSRRIWNLAPWQFSLIYSNPLPPLAHGRAGFLDLSQSCERPDL